MFAITAREIAKRDRHIAWLENELDRKANIISDLADELAMARRYASPLLMLAHDTMRDR